MREHLELLGRKAEDRVTGAKGIVTSISFDLYGCVQAVIQPFISTNGELRDGQWYDVNRIKITNKIPVMQVPLFAKPIPTNGIRKP